jgi:hypothetical protein
MAAIGNVLEMQDLGLLVAPSRLSVANAGARLKNRAGAMGCAPRSNAPATTTMSFAGECRAVAKVTADIKLAQNIVLLCAQKSLRLILVGAKSIVRITLAAFPQNRVIPPRRRHYHRTARM